MSSLKGNMFSKKLVPLYLNFYLFPAQSNFGILVLCMAMASLLHDKCLYKS